MSTVPSLEDCRAYLAQPCAQPDGTSKSVMDHVSQLLLKVLETRPNNSFDLFEEMSQGVKSHGACASFTPGADATVAFAKHVEALAGFAPKPPLADGEEEPPPEEEPANPDCKIANVIQEAALYEAAAVGSGLTRKNAVNLYMGMQKLANTDADLTSLRLWGVVFGTQRDYLVCEGQYSEEYAEPEEEPEPEPEEGDEEDGPKPPPLTPAEPVGTGANKYVYYVANYEGSVLCFDKWTKLPKSRPECIMASRKMKKLFTGDLETPISSYPPFPGLEKDYLRSQITRIASGATACVTGMFIQDPENEEEVVIMPNDPVWDADPPNAGFVPPKAVELSSTVNWTHHPSYPSLLSKMGRCVEPEREDMDEEEAAKLPPQEKGVPLLTSVAADKRVGSCTPAWSARNLGGFLGEHATSVLRSNLWPGAQCIVQQRTFVNVYVGYGHQHHDGGFQPMAPPCVPDECFVEKEQIDEFVPLPPLEPVEEE